MTTDQQVRLLMSLIKKGIALSAAAAKAGMSEPTARKYRRAGQVPSQMKAPRHWRTRPDPFEEVWSEVEALVEHDPALQAKTVFEELTRRYPGRFEPGQLRTLQRRFRRWRALHGPEREVYFPQVHRPGEQAQSDFTAMGALAIVVGGVRFVHLLYHFVLTYSNWESVTVCRSESFEALSEGLQTALWRLGGVPLEHRTDNLSAATHELRNSRGRGYTARYSALLEHYDLRASRNTPGRAHENGDVESSHRGLKGAIDQRLRLRGSREFESLEAYRDWLEALVAERNATRVTRLAEERAVLRALPARPLPVARELQATVSRSSTIRVVGKTYSVPSRLRGERVQVRLFATEVEVSYANEQVVRLPRLSGQAAQHIDYRHIVHSLVRKPGAFRRYAYQEALFPSLVFRRAYDTLLERDDTWADLEYVRILHLAATTMESSVAAVLEALLSERLAPTFEAVRERIAPPAPALCPELRVLAPDLSAYDRLIGAGEQVQA
jgi:hypothetical protein